VLKKERMLQVTRYLCMKNLLLLFWRRCWQWPSREEKQGHAPRSEELGGASTV